MPLESTLLEPPPLFAEPRPHRWTGEEVYRLVELGFFAGRRIELIEGEIVEMAAQSNWHAIAIARAREALEKAFGPAYWVRAQNSLDLSPHSMLDPDLAVIPGNLNEHKERENPTSALLVVEVSETTLRYDRKSKSGVYARASIQDYWIVNFAQGFLEVYRQPEPDEDAEHGFSYQKVNYLEKEESVEPLALPGKSIQVVELMP